MIVEKIAKQERIFFSNRLDGCREKICINSGYISMHFANYGQISIDFNLSISGVFGTGLSIEERVSNSRTLQKFEAVTRITSAVEG